ncbi:hypothetical protein [Pseudomonas sp.]|uniref:hypothetical protein n=1 Tax=Pseudomonas sp. TaxID=306 RepID=UPI002BC9E677|nr:hypothetical protein [Pseudomonas sp.]
MTRWIDKPSLDSSDFIDQIIDTSQRFFSRYFSLIIKAGPPLLGFAIFLFYFHQHRFYPTFDLFQFSSLLLAASVIGFAVVGTSVALLFIAGSWMFHGYLNSPTIKEELKYQRPRDDRQSTHFVLKLFVLLYFLPFAGTAVTLTYVTFNHASLFNSALLILPALITLISGLILQKLFALNRFSFLRFMWASYFSTLVIAFFSILTIRDASSHLETISNDLFQVASVYAVPLAVSVVASVCALSYVAGWNYALHVCCFFGLLIVFYSGALTVLPERTVSSLGLGHYQAEQIIFDAAYCDTPTRQTLAFNESCTLKDVHVVWLMGDTLSYKTTKTSEQLIQVPTRFIKAVIKAVD